MKRNPMHTCSFLQRWPFKSASELSRRLYEPKPILISDRREKDDWWITGCWRRIPQPKASTAAAQSPFLPQNRANHHLEKGTRPTDPKVKKFPENRGAPLTQPCIEQLNSQLTTNQDPLRPLWKLARVKATPSESSDSSQAELIATDITMTARTQRKLHENAQGCGEN